MSLSCTYLQYLFVCVCVCIYGIYVKALYELCNCAIICYVNYWMNSQKKILPRKKAVVLLVIALIVHLLVTLHMSLNHQHSGLEWPKHLIMSPPKMNHESSLAFLVMYTMFLKMLFVHQAIRFIVFIPMHTFSVKTSKITKMSILTHKQLNYEHVKQILVNFYKM